METIATETANSLVQINFVVSATYDVDDAILFVLNVNDNEELLFAYRESDPYSGNIGVYLTDWVLNNSHLIQPYVPQPPGPYNFYVVTLWERLTEEEAEDFDATASVTGPLKIRKQFQLATSMMSDSELFTWVRNILVGLFGETRADALLAE